MRGKIAEIISDRVCDNLKNLSGGTLSLPQDLSNKLVQIRGNFGDCPSGFVVTLYLEKERKNTCSSLHILVFSKKEELMTTYSMYWFLKLN